MHLVSVQRLACSLPAASRIHSLTFRHLTARQPRPCVCLLCPRPAWLLGLMPIAGLSSYRPASFDNAPNFDPRANVGRQDYEPEAGGTGLGESHLAPCALENGRGPASRKGTVPTQCLSNFLSQNAQRTSWSNLRGWPKDSIFRTFGFGRRLRNLRQRSKAGMRRSGVRR
jgi:hypothetical protein